MVRGRPPLFDRALTLSKILILEVILRIVLLLQPAARAICDIDSSPLWVMSEISLCFEAAKFGSIPMWPLRMMVELFVYQVIIF